MQVASGMTGIVIVFLIFGGTASCDDIALGGARQVRGTVESDGADYTITVRFIPVHSLSPGTNLKINQAKGRSYALRVLARYLGKDKSVRLSIYGMKIIANETNGKFLSLAYAVPKHNVTVRALQTAEEKIVASGDRPANPSVRPRQAKVDTIDLRRGALDLLGRVPDHQNTIDELANSWQASLSDSEAEDSRLLWKNADHDCWTLLEGIDSDRLLLNHDKQELSKLLLRHFEQFVTRLVAREEQLLSITTNETD